jgi:hypothetical protein
VVISWRGGAKRVVLVVVVQEGIVAQSWEKSTRLGIVARTVVTVFIHTHASAQGAS